MSGDGSLGAAVISFFSQPSVILLWTGAPIMSSQQVPYKWEDLVRARLSRKLTPDECVAYARMVKFRKLNDSAGNSLPPEPAPPASMEEAVVDAFPSDDAHADSNTTVPQPAPPSPPARHEYFYPRPLRINRGPLFEEPKKEQSRWPNPAHFPIFIALAGVFVATTKFVAAIRRYWLKSGESTEKPVEETRTTVPEFEEKKLADPPSHPPPPTEQIVPPVAVQPEPQVQPPVIQRYPFRVYAP